ncbi:MAG TPA: hypothetical protein VNL16_19160 [Chloroflexota bacterium]|nr:hypothetical protein [Chloroflexota bacterium]
MYSPKIPDRLIPGLYRTARSRGLPMTRLVADVLESYLATQDQDADDRPRDRTGPGRTDSRPGSVLAPERRLVVGGVANAPDSQSS